MKMKIMSHLVSGARQVYIVQSSQHVNLCLLTLAMQAKRLDETDVSPVKQNRNGTV